MKPFCFYFFVRERFSTLGYISFSVRWPRHSRWIDPCGQSRWCRQAECVMFTAFSFFFLYINIFIIIVYTTVASIDRSIFVLLLLLFGPIKHTIMSAPCRTLCVQLSVCVLDHIGMIGILVDRHIKRRQLPKSRWTTREDSRFFFDSGTPFLSSSWNKWVTTSFSLDSYLMHSQPAAHCYSSLVAQSRQQTHDDQLMSSSIPFHFLN